MCLDATIPTASPAAESYTLLNLLHQILSKILGSPLLGTSNGAVLAIGQLYAAYRADHGPLVASFPITHYH